jgi:hypothetical protein
MLRRWIVGTLFMLPVLLCVVLWLGSAKRLIFVHYSANHQT